MNSIETIQSEIEQILGLDSSSLSFTFKSIDGITHLDLTTYNPRHNQSFLFHSTRGIDQDEAMSKMLNYVKSNFKKEDSFTLQWVKIGEQNLHTSYFRAKNLYEVLDKFYHERDVNSYRIYSISLNPIS